MTARTALFSTVCLMGLLSPSPVIATSIDIYLTPQPYATPRNCCPSRAQAFLRRADHKRCSFGRQHRDRGGMVAGGGGGASPGVDVTAGGHPGALTAVVGGGGGGGISETSVPSPPVTIFPVPAPVAGSIGDIVKLLLKAVP